jgi:hypothetical protein
MGRKSDVNRWATVARWAVAVAVYLAGYIFVVPDDEHQWTWEPGGVLLASVTVFWLLKLEARREQERRIDAAELRSSIGR